MFVIINVDDLGLHPAVRRAVAELGAAGFVTSSTLMANGADAEDAARTSGVGVGVHMNILRGRPLSPPQQVSTLVAQNGLFLGDYGKLFARYMAGKVDLHQVELEWGRQIDRAVELGVSPTHLDSEKHIHAWPGMMAVAGRLAASRGIRWVRRPLECDRVMRLDKGGMRQKFLNVCAMFQKRSEGVFWPDLVWGIGDQGAELLPERFARYMEHNERAEVVEIVCHPGKSAPGDPPLPPEYGNMRVHTQWQAEYDALRAPGWAEVFARFGARLVHYGQLTRTGQGPALLQD